MNDRAIALSLVGTTLLAPFVNTTTVNSGEMAMVEDYRKQEQEKMKLEEEKLKTEQAKLLILEKEAKLAEERKAEKERIDSVTFDYSDIRIASNLRTHEVRKILEGTNMVSLAPAFVDAESVYGVNALALIGLVAVESGWNTSRRAVEQYNLTGYAVYSDKAQGKDFYSPYDCIMATAKLLSTDYLSSEGKWHRGYSLYSINTMYSSDKDWYNKIGKIANELLGKYKNNVEVENI